MKYITFVPVPSYIFVLCRAFMSLLTALFHVQYEVPWNLGHSVNLLLKKVSQCHRPSIAQYSLTTVEDGITVVVKYLLVMKVSHTDLFPTVETRPHLAIVERCPSIFWNILFQWSLPALAQCSMSNDCLININDTRYIIKFYVSG